MRTSTPVLTYTYPSGISASDTRPGHTVSGLMFYLDPFQRAPPIKLPRVAKLIEIDTMITSECV